MRLEFAELPDPLVQAHKNGRLVLFVGAGASKAAPSSLPLFDGLASRVAERLDVAAEGTAEERLQELTVRGLNVHAVVHEIISASEAPNAAHQAIASFAMVVPQSRIVTTNYDRHLSACLPDATSPYVPPDLPGSADFTGVVHIHGSIDQDPKRLVVTKDDFAASYMQQNSPTLLFLQRLFTSQTVLFIGYSLKDSLMDYIVKAAAGEADLYTLTDTPDSPHWQNLGVTPVAYRAHDDLPAVLSEWGQRAGATLDDHDQWVASIVSGQTVHDGLSPRDESYLSDVVSDPELVRRFTDHARGPVWFRWVAEGSRTRLLTPSADLCPAEKALAQWFVRHHNDDDQTAAEVLRLIVKNGGRLHETLWLSMAMSSDPRGGASRETANRLLLVLAEVAPPGFPGFDHIVLRLLRHCETPRDDDLFLELVNSAWSPKVRPPDPYWLALQQRGPFEAACTDLEGDPKRRRYGRDEWTRRRHLAADLLSIVDSHLRRVHRIECDCRQPRSVLRPSGRRAPPPEPRPAEAWTS